MAAALENDRPPVLWLPTGPEAMWCVEHSAEEIKALCSELEQNHPLGRLWDIDVICPQAGLISRRAQGRSDAPLPAVR